MPCPGGRPVPPQPPINPSRPPRIRTAPKPDAVDTEVAKSLGRTVAGRAGAGVTVAILDTWPVGRTARLATLGSPDPLVQMAGAGTLATVIDTYLGPGDAGISTCPRTDHGDMYDAKADEADHGLFIAGILKDMAPGATLVAHRICADDGITDLHLTAQAVTAAIQAAEQENQPLVLNMSFGFGPQLAAVHLLLANPASPIQNWQAWMNQVDSIARNKQQATANLSSKEMASLQALASLIQGSGRVLAVAATGNDSQAAGRNPLPRVPAALEGVLGVSAFTPTMSSGVAGFISSLLRQIGRVLLRRSGGWAMDWYSNDDDLLHGNDGIGALGGGVQQSRSGTPRNSVYALPTGGPSGGSAASTAPPGSHRGSLVGLFASPTIPALPGGAAPAPGTALPPGAALNNDGYACWSGTSFATPIAAGYAACIWSEDVTKPAQWVREHVLKERPGTRDREFLPFMQS